MVIVMANAYNGEQSCDMVGRLVAGSYDCPLSSTGGGTGHTPPALVAGAAWGTSCKSFSICQHSSPCWLEGAATTTGRYRHSRRYSTKN